MLICLFKNGLEIRKFHVGDYESCFVGRGGWLPYNFVFMAPVSRSLPFCVVSLSLCTFVFQMKASLSCAELQKFVMYVMYLTHSLCSSSLICMHLPANLFLSYITVQALL